jgi:hypothetical protein
LKIEDLQKKLDLVTKLTKDIEDEVIKQGGQIINGKIIKPEKQIYVMEAFWHGESEYEHYGRYRLIRQIRVLSEEVVNEIKTLITDIDHLQFIDNYMEYNIVKDPLAFGADILDMCGDYTVGNLITDRDAYNWTYNGDFLFEVFIDCSPYNCNGYLSFYSMSQEDFAKFEQYDIDFNKYLMHN